MMTRAKIQIAGLAFLLAGLTGCSGIPWENDYAAGIQRAAQLRRRALIQFCNAMSPECRQMGGEDMHDPDVQRLMANFVPIRVDTAMNKQLTDEFGVQRVPS